MKTLIKVTIVSVAFWISACGSLPAVRVGSSLESGRTKVKVAMPSRGILFVAQKLYGKADCETLKNKLSVSMNEEAVGKPVTTDSRCDYLKGSLVVLSKSPVNKGDYTLRVNRTISRNFRDNPSVFAKYEDPDFAGGPEYFMDGAKELSGGQPLKGTVSYPNGTAEQWIRIKGKNTSTGLTLLLGGDAKGVKAEVYEIGMNGKPVKRVATLQDRKKQSVRVRNNNVMVKVSANAYTGAGDFVLLRGTEGGMVADAGGAGRGVKIPVIDCYQVGSNNSVVLLQAVSGVKVNDEVSVFGRRETGETVAIGSCQVTSIVGSQASCKMDSAVTGYVEYHAEGRISG